MSYISFVKKKNSLELVPNPDGIEEARSLLNDDHTSSDDKLLQMIEFQIGNGWSWLSPSDIGAMTSAPIISDEVFQNDHGDIVLVGRVYWHSNYAVEDPIARFAEGKSVTFQAEGKPISKKTLQAYDRLRQKEESGEDVDWESFVRKHTKD